jgi:hypothetical protein
LSAKKIFRFLVPFCNKKNNTTNLIGDDHFAQHFLIKTHPITASGLRLGRSEIPKMGPTSGINVVGGEYFGHNSLGEARGFKLTDTLAK